MINRRLLAEVRQSKQYIAAHVLFQWTSLAANIALMYAVAALLGRLAGGQVGTVVPTVVTGVAAVLVRYGCAIGASRMSFLAARAVKETLRPQIVRKLLRLGSAYREQVNTSEVVQVAVEGVDQLETYFGNYLPQFFYALLAPVTLFAVLSRVSLSCAVVLLVCVPLIPVAIVAVQRWAKRLLSRYWGQYTALGDTFLENLQGLTTLKIYQADAHRQQQMNEEAERFRKITMKVLTMQLNSITIMDLIAYGGAALGVILSVRQLAAGAVDLTGCLLIILLAAEFFLPMRQLGSYFHIAMNGMAASDKIFRLLDLPEPTTGGADVPAAGGIVCRDLRFAYEPAREILHGVSVRFPVGSFTALVGESGCGKSTLAAILLGRNKGYTGTVTIGGRALTEIREEALMAHISYVGHQSYLFRGTVRDNLRMGCPDAPEEALWAALAQVHLADFVRSEGGLDMVLTEQGANLSGGQRQRLALARALLHDSPVYVFDEATSNIDVESEEQIMAQIHRLAETKTVILISHRLANVTAADNIYVMAQGHIAEAGTHRQLLAQGGVYARLWRAQSALEAYGKEGRTA